MDELGLNVVGAWQLMSGWELLAVILALAYLMLAMMERIECWYAALLSTAIYIFIFWDVDLLMESVLQIYYLLMAVYGWLQWRKQSTVDTQTAKILIHRWSLQQHCLALLTVAVLTAVSGYLLQHNSSAALPYVDSFTTWGAVITTYMVAKKVLENWLYWIVIDSVSVFLYIDRELYLTALLFVTYVVLVFFGYYKWRTIYQHQQPQISG